MTERIRVAFAASTPQEAATLAKAWARAEGMRVRTVCSIRQGEGQMWHVELAVVRP